jgi:hypothetical protein
MDKRNARALADRRIDFRIGINVGDTIVDGDDALGDGVNVAARLEALADAGGICVSGVVRDQVRDKLGVVFEALGAREVKNMARPIEEAGDDRRSGPHPQGRHGARGKRAEIRQPDGRSCSIRSAARRASQEAPLFVRASMPHGHPLRIRLPGNQGPGART